VTFTVEGGDPDVWDHALAALARAGVLSMTSSPPTLEDLFLRHYGADE
jgi:ABC-2 type transport system ATP-binding protein